jgi:hypothetical protein
LVGHVAVIVETRKRTANSMEKVSAEKISKCFFERSGSGTETVLN